MRFWFGSRIRHPYFRGLHLTPASEAKAENAALCGRWEELVRAADAGATVRRAVFVLQSEFEPLLSDAEREVLWRKLRVPAYVLVVDRNNRVLAFECEAQNGLHSNVRVNSEEAPYCECGRPRVSV